MSSKAPLLTDIPIVSVDHLESNNLRVRAAAQVLFEYGLRDIGFVFLKVRWEDSMLLTMAYLEYHQFFHTPLTFNHKRALHRPDLGHQRGWTPPLTERAVDALSADRKECMFFGPEMPKDHPLKKKFPVEYHDNIWPNEKEFPAFKKTTLDLYNQLAKFADVVVAALEQVLKVPRFSWQPDLIKDAPSLMRALYYPPARLATEVVWGGKHTDLNFVTLLPRPTRGGLWAKRRDGTWVRIECPEDCIVVQCGNMLEYLTGGEFLSAEHEIRFQVGVDPRLSIAYFIHILLDTMLAPLLQFANEQTIKKYPPIRALDFLNKRLTDANLKQY